MEGEAAVLELRLVLKTRGHSVGWGSGPPPSTKIILNLTPIYLVVT